MKAQLWRAVVLTVIATGAVFSAIPVRGDYVVAGFNGIRQYSNSGSLLYDSDFIGESIEAITLGPDGYAYVATNDLGFASVYRYDPAAKEFIDDIEFMGGFTGSNKIPDYKVPGPLAFGAQGDIFAISTEFDLEQAEAGDQRVLRIDGQTGELVTVLDGAIPPPPPFPGVIMVDLAVRSNGDLFVGISDGTLQRHVSVGLSTTLVDTLDTGIDDLAWMTFGPDGLLYLRDHDNSIVRYDVDTEQIVDTFVPLVPDTNQSSGDYIVGDILFGHGDDLFAVNNSGFGAPNPDGHFVRMDGATGNYLGIVFSVPYDPGPGLWNHGVYVPIPEPSTLSFAILLIASGSLCQIRQRRRSFR